MTGQIHVYMALFFGAWPPVDWDSIRWDSELVWTRWVREILCHLPGIEQQLLGDVASSLVTVSTELPQVFLVLR